MKPDTPTKTELRGEIARLNLELQKRDKCSFMGPMRDCPTHGESEELKHLRAEVSAWRERLGDDYEYNPDVPYVVMKTPNVEVTGLAAASLPQGPGGLPGSAAREEA